MAGFALSGYALRAHQMRTMKIGDITRGEAGFARHFRFSSMAKYSFRKKRLALRLARDCDCARAMECGSCARRVHMRRPEGFLRRRLRYLRDSGLENALQINPPPLQRSYNPCKTCDLQRQDFISPERTRWASISNFGRDAFRRRKNCVLRKNPTFRPKRNAGCRRPNPRFFGLSANPEIPCGGRAGFRGARTGAGAG